MKITYRGNPPILRIEEGTAGILKVMKLLRSAKESASRWGWEGRGGGGKRRGTVMHRVKKAIELPLEF